MWSCPKCQSKVDPSFDVCWNCGTSKDGVEDPGFVSADAAGPIADPAFDEAVKPNALNDLAPESSPMVACYQAYSLIEAKFLANELSEAGIPALSDAQDMQDALGTMDGNPRVYCREADLDAARAWLVAYEERRKAEGGPVLEG